MPRIISWNTQGNCMNKLDQAHGGLLSCGNDNIILIQEGGNIGQPYKNTFQKSFGRHSFTACFFEQTGVKNLRCSTGMFVENGFFIVDTIFAYQDDKICRRPIVTCHCRYKDSYFVVATVHCTANQQIAAEELEEINRAFRNEYDREDIPWFIMGDFNCQVGKCKFTSSINISYPPNMTHQNGKTLDFAMYSDHWSKKINVRICSDPNGQVSLLSDHFAICCELPV